MAISTKSKRARAKNNKRREILSKVKITNSICVFENISKLVPDLLATYKSKINVFCDKKNVHSFEENWKKHCRKQKTSGFDFREALLEDQ